MSKLIQLFNEGKYDKIASMAANDIIHAVKSKKKELYLEVPLPNVKEPVEIDIEFEYDKTYDTPYAVGGSGGDDSITLKVYINPLAIKLALNDFLAEIKDALRHEIEHVTQFANGNKTGVFEIPAIESGLIKDYLQHPIEVPAFMAGFYTKAKTRKITMNAAMKEYLDSLGVVGNDRREVESAWLKYGMKNYPQAHWE